MIARAGTALALALALTVGARAQNTLPQLDASGDAIAREAPQDPAFPAEGPAEGPADGEVRSLFRVAPPPPEGQDSAPATWSDPTFLRPESVTRPAVRASLRMLDTMTGRVEAFDVAVGETVRRGRLAITLDACRVQPPELPADAFAHLAIRDSRDDAPRFVGWMIASTPSVSALDHQRYDVWVTSCSTSVEVASADSAKKSD